MIAIAFTCLMASAATLTVSVACFGIWLSSHLRYKVLTRALPVARVVIR